jgi:hypothetical protein
VVRRLGRLCRLEGGAVGIVWEDDFEVLDYNVFMQVMVARLEAISICGPI